MQRIAVVGCSGSGKSTFAARLGELLELEVIHLDRHYWRPGWVATPRDEWRRVQQGLVAGERWIVDGNYSGTLDIRFARADTIVFFDLPLRTCLLGVLRRRARHHGQPVQAAGCPEKVDWEFVRWMCGYRRRSRPKVLAAAARYAPEAQLIMISSRRAAADVLAGVSGGQPSAAGGRSAPRATTQR